MFEYSPRLPLHARAFYRAVFVVALSGLCFLPKAVGQDALPNANADRAAPNESVEIEPSSPEAVATSGVADDQPVGSQVEENLEEVVPAAASAPVRTLRPRSSETSVLGRPDTGNTPWYRSGIGALSIVLAVIVGVFFVMRRFVPAMRAPEGEVLKVVARATLTPKQTLSLIQLGRRFVLVAISAGRVDMLCEVNDTDEVAELMMATGARFPGSAGRFDARLRQETANYDASAVDELEDATDSVQRERGRAVSDLLARLKTLQRTG